MEKSKHNVRTIIVAFGMLLMFAIVAITGTITYSRYTTNETATMQATAAKWGYVITVNASNMLGGDSNVTVTSNDNGVSATAMDAVIVPGSSGSVTFTINGTAEVASRLRLYISDGYKEIGLTLTKWGEYYPIQWSLTSDELLPYVGTNTLYFSNLSEMNNTFAYALQYNAFAYNAGTNFSDFSMTIGWEWPFDGNDTYDTILSRLASGEELQTLNAEYASKLNENNLEKDNEIEQGNTQMSFEISAIIEQVQDVELNIPEIPEEEEQTPEQ